MFIWVDIAMDDMPLANLFITNCTAPANFVPSLRGLDLGHLSMSSHILCRPQVTRRRGPDQQFTDLNWFLQEGRASCKARGKSMSMPGKLHKCSVLLHVASTNPPSLSRFRSLMYASRSPKYIHESFSFTTPTKSPARSGVPVPTPAALKRL